MQLAYMKLRLLCHPGEEDDARIAPGIAAIPKDAPNTPMGHRRKTAKHM